jgi:lipopolysaccharide exporter
MTAPDAPEGFGSSLRGGVAWSTVTFVAAKALTFVSMLVLARLLVPAEFGVVAAVATFLAFVELGSDLGMKATVVYEQEGGYSERLDTAFTLNIALVVVFTAGGVALAPLVAAFFHLEGQTHLFRLGVLSLLLTGMGNIHDGLLLRDLAFRRRAVPELIRGAVRAAVSIPFAVAGFGAESLVFGMLAGSAAWSAAQWFLSPYRPRLAFDRGIARTMIGYGVAASLLQVLTVVSQNADKAAVGRVVGDAALGLYTIGFRIPELLISNVGQVISIVAFPALARKRSEDEAGMVSATLTLLRYQALYSLTVAVALAVLAPPLVVVLFGDAWRPAGGVMSAIAIMAGIATVIYPLGDVFKALARQRILVALNCVQIPLLIAAIIATAPNGILAVAWARTGAMALFAVLFLREVKRVLGLGLGELALAVRPAAVTAAVVALSAGAVRLAWPALEVGPLLAATVAAVVGGLAAVRLTAPDLFGQLRAAVESLRPRRRAMATSA